MRNKLHIAVAACAALLAGAPAVGQSPAAASPAATPRPGLSYFVGGWDIAATDPADGTTAHFTYEVGPLVGTSWISGRGRSEELSLESSDVWGLDSASGELMRFIFDGSGTYAVVRSSGWQGERLVLEGDARSTNGVVRVRETIMRLSEDAFVATWEAYRNGTWSAYSVERAIRRAART